MADWKRFFLKYFDANGNKKVDWWEYLIPISCLLAIEFTVEFAATYIYNNCF